MPANQNTFQLTQSGVVGHPALRNPQNQSWHYEGNIADGGSVDFTLPSDLDGTDEARMGIFMIAVKTGNDLDFTLFVTDGAVSNDSTQLINASTLTSPVFTNATGTDPGINIDVATAGTLTIENESGSSLTELWIGRLF